MKFWRENLQTDEGKANDRESVAIRKQKLVNWLAAMKENFGCHCCGCSDSSKLEWRPRDPYSKAITVTAAAWQGWSKASLLKEITQNYVVCEKMRR